MSLDTTQLQKALWDMPIETLLTEIPEIQNSMVHLIRSNNDMKEYDPEGRDTDLTTAIEENKDLIRRKNKRIDLTLEVIRERINEAAATEMASSVTTFRDRYLTNNDDNNDDGRTSATDDGGVYL